MTQQSSANWLSLAKQLKVRQVNVDVNEARAQNKSCQKEIMLKETSLYKMIEFDLWIYIFAIFQLGMTNLIVFKINFKYMDSDLVIFSVLMLARRILCKANHYYQVNIYRVNLFMFTVLRSIPLTIFFILVWSIFKVTLFHSLVNVVCMLLP